MQLSNREKFLLYAELAKLVAAGFGIDKSTELLSQQMPHGQIAGFARGIRDGLRCGFSFADSVAQAKPTPSGLEVSILRATESGGVLPEGLRYLRDEYQAAWKLWQSVLGRLAYPVFLLHFAALVPVIPPLFTGGAFQDGLMRALWTLGWIYGIGFGLFQWVLSLMDRAQTDVASDRFLRRLPLFGGARRDLCLQRFASIFQVYLRCGSTFSVALDGAGEATQSAVLAKAADDLASRAEAGEAIGEHLQANRVFPTDFARSLANAERVGGLEEDLGRWTAHYRQTVADRLDQIGVWVPKAIFAMVAVYVGWQIIQTQAATYGELLKNLERSM
ncbi:MAG: Type II secretory pathway, component PulF/Type II secretory pathway, component PulF [Verrucomicrobia bacterium]|nr:MAG: Type II secretory pathway, component PulF/Type II secretory pathway, component PulF [Verrucomicrobiota bacterium]